METVDPRFSKLIQGHFLFSPVAPGDPYLTYREVGYRSSSGQEHLLEGRYGQEYLPCSVIVVCMRSS
jgi:hypothetical protein